jgi:hypothetical protein
MLVIGFSVQNNVTALENEVLAHFEHSYTYPGNLVLENLSLQKPESAKRLNRIQHKVYALVFFDNMLYLIFLLL